MINPKTVYVVSEETNEVIRTSRSYLAALNFALSLPMNTYYLCTSELDLKKGQVMSNIKNFLAC